MKPLIGITSNVSVETDEGRSSNVTRLKGQYAEALMAAGGAPIILPLATEEIVGDVLARLDGLVLSGGADIPPQFFGAEPHPACHYMSLDRWRSECLWLRTAEKLRVPVLGICLGMQVINVAAGGTLIQDIPSQRPNSQAHTGPGIGCQHDVQVVEGTLLAKMAPSSVMGVTSSHHQAVDKLANGYRVGATAPDGVIEAIEAASGPCIVGVQWHPERCLDQPNWTLKGFVKICGEHACAGRSDASGTGCPMSTVLNKMLDG